MSKAKTERPNIQKQLQTALSHTYRYRKIIYFVFIAVIYGFILFRVNSLSTVQPTESALEAAAQSNKQPHIDKAIVQKIQELQDNSVGVKSLFDQARQNPFQE